MSQTRVGFGVAALFCVLTACEQQPDTPTAAGAAAYSRGDYATALSIFQPLGEQGNVTAQFDLAVMYASGRGVVQDYVEALKWYRLAADQRDADAQNNIGNLYFAGRGVPEDKVRAYMWFNLSASALKARDAEAGIKNRALAAATMSGPEIAQAQQLSVQCSRQEFKGCDDLLGAGKTEALTSPKKKLVTARPEAISPSVTPVQHVIPLEANASGTYRLTALINGALTNKFMLDTGASDVSIPSDLYWALVRAGTVEQSDLRDPQIYTLADGSKQISRTFIIHSLRVGDVVVENVLGSVSKDGASSLLGQTFLRRLNSWSIDYTHTTLVIR